MTQLIVNLASRGGAVHSLKAFNAIMLESETPAELRGLFRSLQSKRCSVKSDHTRTVSNLLISNPGVKQRPKIAQFSEMPNFTPINSFKLEHLLGLFKHGLNGSSG
jgi:hypothetical protein